MQLHGPEMNEKKKLLYKIYTKIWIMLKCIIGWFTNSHCPWISLSKFLVTLSTYLVWKSFYIASDWKFFKIQVMKKIIKFLVGKF